MPIKSAELFRRHVLEIMQDQDVSMQSVADKAGMKRPSLSRILAGKENVTLERAERIAHAIGVKLHELLTPFSAQKSA